MNPKKHYFARIPGIVLFILLAVSPWLSILLFILRAIDRDAEKKERLQAQYSSDFCTAPSGSGYVHDEASEEQRKAKQRHKTLTLLCACFGGLFLLAGLAGLPDALAFFDLGELFSCLAQMVGGGGALWLGIRMDRARKLERQLDRIVGSRDYIPLAELFAAAGVTTAEGRSALDSAIDHGYFGADAYIDNRTDTLVVRGQPPIATPPPQPQPDPMPEDQYARLLRQLREANDAISDPTMSSKIDRLEQISARIFALAKQDPDKQPQLKKFMDYYLPTALKLLNTYAQMAMQDVQGANISEATRSIERSMDLLVTAFENQLDKLFQADALDVSADIAALEGMLNLDGLTGSDFS